MCQLKLHKSVRANAAAAANDEETASATAHLNSGTKDILSLVFPWARSGRVVVADIHFASVQAAHELYKIGLRFIGCLKTATRGFPIRHLGSVQLAGCSSQHGMYHKLTNLSLPDLIAFTWCDKERRCFTSSCSNL
jgi:hypothetical protein